MLERCNPELQMSLDSEAVVDAMDAEQTWPTEDELRMAEGFCSDVFLFSAWGSYGPLKVLKLKC